MLSPQGGFFEEIAEHIVEAKFDHLKSCGIFPYCFKLDGPPELELANFCLVGGSSNKIYAFPLVDFLMAEAHPEAERANKMIALLASDFSTANKGAMK